jgi:Tol biopolymer transport system component
VVPAADAVRLRRVFPSTAVLCALVAGVATAAVPDATLRAGAEQLHPALYLVHVGNGQLRRVLVDASGDGPPLSLSWTSDGRAVLYERSPCDGCFEIRLVRLASGRRGLGARIASGLAPSLAADGRTLVYLGSDGALYRTTLGSDRVREVSPGGAGPGEIDQPRVSPDGRRIAFAREGPGGIWSIDTIPADGGGERRLTPAGLSTANPAWSPDGRTIAFAAQGRDLRWRIELMNADGGHRRVLPGSHGSDSYPTWSPDGRRIAFVHQSGDRHSIYVVGVDGRGERRLTPASLDAIQPAWSPLGDEIAFAVEGASPD